MGTKLRKWRETRGLSQAALGDAIGRSFQVISSYEQAGKKVSDPVLDAICKRFDVSKDEIMGDDQSNLLESASEYRAEFRLEILGEVEIRNLLKRLLSEMETDGETGIAILRLETIRALCTELERRIKQRGPS